MPTEYSKTCVLRNGSGVRLRPIRPEDEPMMAGFHETLSDESVHSRYFHLIELDQRVAHERLTKVCSPDPGRETAIVAVHTNSAGAQEILGVGRMVRLTGRSDAEIAVIVCDAYQYHGLGTELMTLLVEIARREKLGRLSAITLPENHSMQDVLRHLGFSYATRPKSRRLWRSFVYESQGL
jgi:acetyltransferase